MPRFALWVGVCPSLIPHDGVRTYLCLRLAALRCLVTAPLGRTLAPGCSCSLCAHWLLLEVRTGPDYAVGVTVAFRLWSRYALSVCCLHPVGIPALHVILTLGSATGTCPSGCCLGCAWGLSLDWSAARRFAGLGCASWGGLPLGRPLPKGFPRWLGPRSECA